jgi:hypothetical protein
VIAAAYSIALHHCLMPRVVKTVQCTAPSVPLAALLHNSDNHVDKHQLDHNLLKTVTAAAAAATSAAGNSSCNPLNPSMAWLLCCAPAQVHEHQLIKNLLNATAAAAAAVDEFTVTPLTFRLLHCCLTAALLLP